MKGCGKIWYEKEESKGNRVHHTCGCYCEACRRVRFCDKCVKEQEVQE